MPTIAEEIRTWKLTKGNPNPDFKNLLEKLVDYSRRNNYDLVIETPDYSNTTFHPLKVPLTIKEAGEKYIREGDKAIDPGFIDLVKKVEEHNHFCKQGEVTSNDILFGETRDYGDTIDKIEVTDYMHFLYFANKIMKNLDFHDPNPIIRQGLRKLFRKKQIEVKDPNPIIIITNPEKDGLIDIFKKGLRYRMTNYNNGLRVFNLGGEEGAESLRDFYFNPDIKDFDSLDSYFLDPSKEYFGIFAKNAYIKARFSGNNDLLGIENKIKGEYVFDGCVSKSSYRSNLINFNKLKNPKEDK
jgi:hypothetical protein